MPMEGNITSGLNSKRDTVLGGPTLNQSSEEYEVNRTIRFTSWPCLGVQTQRFNRAQPRHNLSYTPSILKSRPALHLQATGTHDLLLTMPLERTRTDFEVIDPADVDFERIDRIDELFFTMPVALDTVDGEENDGDLGDALVRDLFEEWPRPSSPDIFDGVFDHFPDSASDTPSLCSDSPSDSESTYPITTESSDDEEVSPSRHSHP